MALEHTHERAWLTDPDWTDPATFDFREEDCDPRVQKRSALLVVRGTAPIPNLDEISRASVWASLDGDEIGAAPAVPLDAPVMIEADDPGVAVALPTVEDVLSGETVHDPVEDVAAPEDASLDPVAIEEARKAKKREQDRERAERYRRKKGQRSRSQLTKKAGVRMLAELTDIHVSTAYRRLRKERGP